MAETLTAPALPPARARVSGSAGTLGLRVMALGYVALLVLLPVVVICYRTFAPGLAAFSDALTNPEARHAFVLSAVVALCAVAINTVFGVAVAILLARHRFWGRRLLNALIDLPIAVSPIVVGLALILVFGPTGWFGSLTSDGGIKVIGAEPGMVLATAFVSVPLVARAVIPVLEQVGLDQEQAAASLGANAFARFRRITLPAIRVGLTYGVVLSLARCLGEYGAVLVVSYNIEGQTETAALRISNVVYNEQDYDAAYAITFVLMIVALAAIVAGAWIRRRGNS